MPDFNERYFAAQKINTFLKENCPKSFEQDQILIQFYRAPEHHVTSEILVEQFIERYGVPQSQNGRLFFHDTNFHFGAILIPSNFLVLAALHTYILVEFCLHAFNSASDLLEARKLLYTLIHERALDLDGGTASATVININLNSDNPDESLIMDIVKNDFASFIGEGESPIDFLKTRIERLHRLVKSKASAAVLESLKTFQEQKMEEDWINTFANGAIGYDPSLWISLFSKRKTDLERIVTSMG